MKEILKTIYGCLPFKKELFQFINSYINLPSGIYKHLHFKGVIKLKTHNKRQLKIFHHGHFIENELFWNDVYGGWERQSLMLWSKFCEGSENILDVGANTGIYTLLAAAINPKANIHSFEPIEEIYEKLEYNVSLNDFKINTNMVAISDIDGESVIYNPDSEHSYSASLNQDFLGSESKTLERSVICRRLDSYINASDLSEIDLIKLDVEGNEFKVLLGLGRYLKEFTPTILIEILSEREAEKIENLLSGLNYLYFNIGENGESTQVQKLTKSLYHNFIICRPSKANLVSRVLGELGVPTSTVN